MAKEVGLLSTPALVMGLSDESVEPSGTSQPSRLGTVTGPEVDRSSTGKTNCTGTIFGTLPLPLNHELAISKLHPTVFQDLWLSPPQTCCHNYMDYYDIGGSPRWNGRRICRLNSSVPLRLPLSH